MRYRFNRIELDLDRQELLADGAPRPVEPQVFDLLRHMVESGGRLVTRDELIKVVWHGRIVSDATVSTRINAARQAVDDDGTKQEVIKTVPRRGFRFVADITAEPPAARAPEPHAERSPPANAQGQKLKFCTSADGTRLAFATVGSGPPLLRAGHWLTHLEHDWHSPVWRPFLAELSKHVQLTRYDQRGNGLSDWSVTDFSLERFADDLEAVADAAGLDRFAIYATSQGVPVAIAYAVRNPHRISHLVLHGGFARGRARRASPAEREQAEALLTLIRHGWGKEGSPFIKAFTAMYIPGGNDEQAQSFTNLQRLSTTPENAVRLRSAVDDIDVTELLSKVAVPTLIIHARNDGVQPLDQARTLAAGIPGAEFLLLESPNHVILPQEPAWPQLVEAIGSFVATETAG